MHTIIFLIGIIIFHKMGFCCVLALHKDGMDPDKESNDFSAMSVGTDFCFGRQCLLIYLFTKMDNFTWIRR